MRMMILELLNNFFESIDSIDSQERLFDVLSDLCSVIGFRYFALTHHVNFTSMRPDAFRIHNYPAEFAQYFDKNALGVRDPVHRASQLRGAGFLWSTLPALLQLSKDDKTVLERAARSGIGDGYTVPFHVPGEYSGSCSFAVSPGTELRADQIPIAQLLGTFAFEAARQLHARKTRWPRPPILLTPRQREIVVWLGRGKSEEVIAQILSCSTNTINTHLKAVRERCGVGKSAQLVIYALVDGVITYNELLHH
jgi:LuxR family quorum-sensing system transcriptional regulator CciR